MSTKGKPFSKESVYREICREYFPRWKPWKFIVARNASPYDGFCDDSSKTIYVGSINKRLIIHEISHAVTTGGHGKKWMNRMLLAAEHADKFDPELANQLRQEVQGYIGEPNITASYIYSSIQDGILDVVSNGQEVNIDDVLTWVRQQTCGYIWTDKIFERRYKRARAVAEEALKEALRWKKAKEKFKKKS